jgi:hypothetical protein
MPRHGEKGIEELIIALLRGCDPNGVPLTPSKLDPGSTDDNFWACYNNTLLYRTLADETHPFNPIQEEAPC